MKKLFCFVITLLLAVSLPSTALANTNENRVVDDADLLSSSEEKALAEKVDPLVEKYNFDIVIVTNTSLEGLSRKTYAEDFFDYNGYGIGDDYSGILYLFSTEYKDYHISTTGYGLTAFTNYGISYINDQVTPFLRDKEYYKAFDKYVTLVDRFLAEAKAGTPFDVNHKVRSQLDYIKFEAIVVIVSFVLALIILLVMKSTMKTANKRTTAKEYVRNGSMTLNEQRDVYMYSNVRKIRIQTNSSGGGGSSSHTSSSGRSHGGGGGRL